MEVDDSRQTSVFGGSKRRRRFCSKCKEKFTTYEIYIKNIESIISNEKLIRKQKKITKEFISRLENISNEIRDEGDLPPDNFDLARNRL
jgi:transcriptional regulator NrdR family protein